MPAPMGVYAWKNAWPEVPSPNAMEKLTAGPLQEISRIMRHKAKACGKPSLLRMGYAAYPELRGWEHFTMPMAAWQADCLFCEFMPPADREEAWLAGSHRVRVVEVGWTPVGCAILGSLFKPPQAHLPTIWEMAKDLAA
eukprot:5955224-Amphidinium_carterae.1